MGTTESIPEEERSRRGGCNTTPRTSAKRRCSRISEEHGRRGTKRRNHITSETTGGSDSEDDDNVHQRKIRRRRRRLTGATSSTADDDGGSCTSSEEGADDDKKESYRPTTTANYNRAKNIVAEEKVDVSFVSGTSTTKIKTPNKNDVLLGRGRNVSCHPGNVFFRQLVREKRGAYMMSWKSQKGLLAKQIVEQIRSPSSSSSSLNNKNKNKNNNNNNNSNNPQPGGRFIEMHPDGNWREVSNQKAIVKASQALREKKW